MEKNMYERLVATEKRLNEIDELLMKEEVTRDNRRFKELNIR